MTTSIDANRILSSVVVALGLAAYAGVPAFGAVPPQLTTPPELLGEAESPQRMEAELAFRHSLEQEDYSAARLYGQELLPLLERDHGIHSLELVEPLTGLARSQRQTGDPAEAERTLRRAIDLAQRHAGHFSAAMLGPKFELGLTYQALQEHGLAVATFTEVQAISRRVSGLLNETQLDAIDQAVHSLVMMGEAAYAEERAEEAFTIRSRAVGADSPELLPALYRYARWMHQLERFDQERDAYTQAISIIEGNGGEKDPQLVHPLRGIAASLRAERSYREDELYGRRGPIDSSSHLRAERSLRRALDIVRAQDDAPPALEAMLVLELGDWFMTLGRRQTAMAEYRRVWEMLDGTHPELLQRWFDEAVALRLPEPQRRGSRSLSPPPALSPDAVLVSAYDHLDPGMLEGVVTVRYQVDERGEIRDSRVVESNPQRRMDHAVLESLRRARYRPRFEDGEPVVSEYQYYEFRYSYRP